MAITKLEAMFKMITEIENCEKDMKDVAKMILDSVDEIKQANDNSDATWCIEKNVCNTTLNLLNATTNLGKLKKELLDDYVRFKDYEEN